MLNTLNLIAQDAHWPFKLLMFIIGAIVGSFLNIVIYRLPLMLQRQWHEDALDFLDQEDTTKQDKNSLIKHKCPSAPCHQCNSSNPFWGNIPIVGYLLMGGRCQQCKAKISFSYPLTELLCAGLFLLAASQTNASFLALLASLTFIGFCLCIIMIDAKHLILPDILSLSLLWLGLIFNCFVPIADSLQDAILGSALGYGILWVIYKIAKLIMRRDGMGYGDFKLLAALGAWFGFAYISGIMVSAGIMSFLFAVWYGITRPKNKNQGRIAFGPFLGISGIICLFYGHAIMSFIVAK